MLRGFSIVIVALGSAGACGVKGPPLPPEPAQNATVERLKIQARRMGGEWWVRAALSSFARFTIARRAADCPEGKLVLVTDGTTREVEVRERTQGRQRFTVVAETSNGERFERSIEVEENGK